MKHIFTTTLRLNLNDEDDRRAFEYLQRLDKRQHRSYSKAVVVAVNSYFERWEQEQADPYLETREKEDAFLQRVMETIEGSLQRIPAYSPVPAMQNPSPPVSEQNEEDISAALDFANSF
jgi:hypothetical protein